MCCNLPDVAPRVLHRGAPVAVRRVDGFLYGKSTGLERPLIGLVGILHIDIEEGFSRFARTATIADQDQRIANPHFSRGASPHFAAGAKDQFEETDDATNVLREHPRDNGRPAIWSEIGRQPSLAAVKSAVLRITQLRKPSSLSSFTLRNIIRNSPGVLQSSSTPHIGLTDAAIPPLLAGASRVNGV